MTDAGQMTDESTAQAPPPITPRGRILVVLAVLVVFAIIIGVRMFDTPGGQSPSASDVPGGADPVAVLDAAIAAGEPAFVFFHSGACAPCIEMEGVVDRVFPEYEASVAFVDAKTDDPRTGPLFSRFAFQYIPSSFFIGADGEIASQHTGVLTDDEMRSRLDAIVGSGE